MHSFFGQLCQMAHGAVLSMVEPHIWFCFVIPNTSVRSSVALSQLLSSSCSSLESSSDTKTVPVMARRHENESLPTPPVLLNPGLCKDGLYMLPIALAVSQKGTASVNNEQLRGGRAHNNVVVSGVVPDSVGGRGRNQVEARRSISRFFAVYPACAPRRAALLAARGANLLLRPPFGRSWLQGGIIHVASQRTASRRQNAKHSVKFRGCFRMR
jgi:hypothetical protein